MLTATPIETPRLILRPESTADSADIYRMNADPEVMQFVADGRAWTSPLTEFVEEHRAVLAYHGDTNYGGLSVFLKDTGAFIGLCWLTPAALLDGEMELGYRYVRSAWGKGYATEAGRATLTTGFERTGTQSICSTVHPQNLASIRVLEKLGFRHVREMFHPRARRDVCVYQVDCPK